MDPKFVAGMICFSTRRKSPVAGPSGEPCVLEKRNGLVTGKKGTGYRYLKKKTNKRKKITDP